ncbi:GNAT family N-acetyltransferase [Rubrobacter aplysinae]|uniref:GNAT family N-acetyltransferase n=1 Tax=Rubrobacter aplysinae TaxID=909625 RepID=UPI00064BC52C|nr:GNAT family N-acetyltransferase [Rubrobacter aplysinae]
MRDTELLRRVPNTPRWLETRSLLLSGSGEVSGASGDGFVVADAEDGLVCIFGEPAAGDIREAALGLSGARAVLCAPENRGYVAEALPGYEVVRAVLHLPGDDGLRVPETSGDTVRLIGDREVEESLQGVSEELRRELRIAVRRSPVAAATFEGAPVSFCYAAARTETLWDVSIATAEGFRRLGLATACVSYMVGIMEREGLIPVWGAEEPNAASLALAARLGFVPVDEAAVFHPGAGDTDTAPGAVR